jgi:hypothetical protein
VSRFTGGSGTWPGRSDGEEGAVTSGGARRGRRDNGLVAAVYAAAGDVDPRVGEHLLDVLALRGIAAYLQPASDLHPVTRTTTLPARPTDRLFVDREHLQTARDFVAQLAEEPEKPRDKPASSGDPDIDELFAGIVAGYETTTATPTWPAAEDLPAEDPPATADLAAQDLAAQDLAAPDLTDDTGPGPDAEPLQRWRGSTVDPMPFPGEEYLPDDEDDDEGYVPPPPPPLPRVSLVTIAAVVGIVAGFVLFFNPQLLPITGAAALAIGFAAILGGFATLVWRLRSGDDDDDDWDPDDGAVV